MTRSFTPAASEFPLDAATANGLTSYAITSQSSSAFTIEIAPEPHPIQPSSRVPFEFDLTLQ